ncbi:MAG: glycosyltransferase [Thermoanaerobaculaceae bacterium]|nr:glycosyltransferase [Thermoanaerobaculaceae bacterium]
MTPLKLLWASPLPPIRSGVADYAAEILPALAERADVVVVRPPGWEAPPGAAWARGLSFLDSAAATPPDRLSLLHLGNNPYHLWIAKRLRQAGGIVVLHDTVLHHLLVEEAATEGAWERFEEELEMAHPGQGGALARGRRWGFWGRLDPFLFPARRALLAHAQAVIVHSRRAAQVVAADLPATPVRCVPLAVARVLGDGRRAMRARLGARAGELVVVHLGYLTPAKGLATVLEGVAALRSLGVAVRLVVVGEESGFGSLEPTVRSLGLEGQVVVWGWATQEELADLLAAADVGVVPRYPTAGETSAAALRFLAAGKPILVSGYAQFLELPAEAALRLCPDAAGVADFVRHLASFSGERRKAAGRAAQRAWREGGHDPRDAAQHLLAAVGEVAGGLAGRG